MLSSFRLSLLIWGFCTATTLAYPTWWLGAVNFRCKAPYYVESFTDDWGEWRVSSICAPGTCCSSWANTGPLCTAEACEMAGTERERLLQQYNAAETRRKKQQKAQEAQNSLQKQREAEQSWKQKEAQEDAQKRDPAKQSQFSSEWRSSQLVKA